MGWFDAVVHSFSTLSLGGFSSHDASFASSILRQSRLRQFFSMLIGGINFGTHSSRSANELAPTGATPSRLHTSH